MDIGVPDRATISVTSPLTNSTVGINLVRRIDVDQVIAGYRNRLGIDVSALFTGIEALNLMHDRFSGMSFFHPLITGNEDFYATLLHRQGYHRAEKAEFRIAAQFIPPGAHVLEVGAGIGHFATHLTNANYLGLEFNADAALAAFERGILVIPRDVRELAEERHASFDVTCAFQVLEHVPDPRGVITAMVALTRPGGLVILATPNADGYISRCRDILNVPPHHVTWWSDQTWRWVADTFGLVDLRLHRSPIEEMPGPWAQMIASNGLARQLGVTLDPVVDETALRHRIDVLAEPLARTIVAGMHHRADAPEAGHTTVAIFTKPMGEIDANA